LASRSLSPPTPDEVEVSVFGPGVGECIVVHLGGGEWMIVDSCLDGSDRHSVPVALRYFGELGVNVATAVRLVVITHWHDDHIRGIADVFRRCLAAEVVISSVLETTQFLALARLAKSVAGAEESALDEFVDLHAELVARKPSSASWPLGIPIHAMSQRILSRNMTAGTVMALSPSDAAFQKGQIGLAERLDAQLQTGRRLVAQGPNEAAIALWIEAGNRKILLGSDLEVTVDPRDGWSAVIADGAGAHTGGEVFKVAHHGSANGHDPNVWTTMLVQNPHALLTPFRRSHLPQPRDIARLNKITDTVFLTASATSTKPKKRSSAVDGQLNAVAKRRRITRVQRPGHVRLRMKRGGGAPVVDLFDGARKL
jgi:beta-lactamase superfamily II metal-dependent hydrolase